MGVVSAPAIGARVELTEAAPAQLRIELLGCFRVETGYHAIEPSGWKLHKAAQLVQLLALAPGHRIQREQVLDLLWPNFAPSAATNNLRVTLHAARRALNGSQGSSGQFLQYIDRHLYLLREGTIWVDVLAFENAAECALATEDIASIEAALSLYTGRLTVDSHTHWSVSARDDALLNLYLSLLLTLANIRERRGERFLAVSALKSVLTIEPTNEEAHTGLMRLYTRMGRRTWALSQFRQLQQILRAELDIEPSREARQLYETIMLGDPPQTRSSLLPEQSSIP